MFVYKYLPNTKSCAKLVNDLAVELNNRSIKVTVFTLSSTQKEMILIESQNDIDIVTIKSGRINSANNNFEKEY